MKRLSRSLITTLLVVLLAFVVIGCRTTPEVEVFEPVTEITKPEAPTPPPAEVVTPPVEVAPAVVTPEAAPAPAPAPAPVAVERKAPTADMV
ncbi:MAG: hypothetical protein RBT44_09690, partial [Sphaerochaetaceae bacterium]|nr:hypothetical protein [Sphaerochaetaceae bacterium]